jgi:pSer/pThr/pTyr-binding forkhead associated (FHA) protein
MKPSKSCGTATRFSVTLMPQRLILEIVQGSLQGQTIVVPEGSTLLIGRLPECGLAVPQDLTVSRQHCRIEYRPPECRLVHLSQTGNTSVNDVPVEFADLRRGDQITFGAGNRVKVSFDEAPGGSPSPTIPASSARGAQANQYVVSDASCGWKVYFSTADEPGFRAVLDALASSLPVHALFDCRRAGQPLPPEMTGLDYLFGWMPPGAREQFSPVFVSLAKCPEAVELIRAGWGKDAIVCCGSRLPTADLLAHWKAAIGAPDDRPGSALTAYFWPSLLDQMLTCQSASQTAPLLSGLNWLLIEDRNSPGQWKLFASDDFDPVLTAAGWQRSTENA